MGKPFGTAIEVPHLAPSVNPPSGSSWIYPKADGKWYSRSSAGVETPLGAEDANAVHKTGDENVGGVKTFTSKVVLPSAEITPSTGTARGRFGGLSGVEAWTGMFLNCTYVAGSGWLLDDPTKVGWFFKMDSRAIATEFAVYRIPAGAGYHTDEAMMFKVGADGLFSVINRITGLSNASGATDALPKGQADTLYATTGHAHELDALISSSGLSSFGTFAVLNAADDGYWTAGKLNPDYLDPAYVDGGAAYPSMRSLGTGATQAAAGNHTHSTANVTGLDSALATRPILVEYTTSVPARPATSGKVIWQGQVDPAANALAGDSWWPTA